MKSLSIRELRVALPRLDKILAKHGEIVIAKRGQALARIVPMPPARRIPSNKDLRDSMPFQETESAVYIREDRDAR